MRSWLSILFCLLALPVGAATWYIDIDVTGTSNNTGTNWANACTNFLPFADASGYYTDKAAAGDTIYVSGGIYPPTYGSVIGMYGLNGSQGSPITFKVSQEVGHNDVVRTPPFGLSGSWFTFDGAKSDTFTNSVDLNNVAQNIWNITNNIGWWIRGIYGFGSNSANGINVTTVGAGMRFLWLHVDPYTFNTNNWPYGGSSEGVGANTYGFLFQQSNPNVITNTEVGYCLVEHVDQCCFAMLNNGLPGWDQLRIHHCIAWMQGDAVMRSAGGLTMDHNLLGKNWMNHGHPNGVVFAGKYTKFHHNILHDVNDAITYMAGSKSMVGDLYIYNNLFYQDWDWTFVYTNEFSANLPFINSSKAGSQWLVEENGGHVVGWLPQHWTNIVVFNNTWITGTGAQSTNSDAGLIRGFSFANRYSPGMTLAQESTTDSEGNIVRGFVYLDDVKFLNNLVFDYSGNANHGGNGFPGWSDRYDADPNTWTNPAITYTSGFWITNTTLAVMDYNLFGALGTHAKRVYYNGPLSTSYFDTAEDFNTAYSSNGWTHSTSASPAFADTNAHDFRLDSSDTAAFGKGTNLSSFSSYPGGMEDLTMDLAGVQRPAVAWSMGAYEPEGLIFHLTFEDDFTSASYITDQSGNSRHAYKYGFPATPTNWPTRVLANTTPGVNSNGYAADFRWSWSTYGHGTHGQYAGVQTNTSAFTNMNQATFALWARYFNVTNTIPPTATNDFTVQANIMKEQRLLSTSDDSSVLGTWKFGRVGSGNTRFVVTTNAGGGGAEYMRCEFPDSGNANNGDTINWNHYAATWSNGTATIYINGSNVTSITTHNPSATNLTLDNYTGIAEWFGVGVDPHSGTPLLEDEAGEDYPNHAWLDGVIDDVRIYNRALTATEITNLYASFLGVEAEDTAPTITGGPSDASKYVGQTATFTVTATGTAPLTYQWSWHGTNVSGATTTTWTTPALVLFNNNSTVTIGVTNAVGGVSDDAALTVSEAPAGGATWTNVTLRGAIFK